MRILTRRLGGLALVALLPADAAAQEVAQSFGELPDVLKNGQTVVVTDENSRTMKGRALDVTTESFDLLGRERWTFVEDSVARIKRVDPLWNGVLIGALGGLAFAGIAAATCNREEDAEACAAGAAVGWLVATPMGAGIGLLVDAVNRPTIYRGSLRRSGVRVSPVVQRGRHGVMLSVGF